jgi:hypothetical protein
LRRMRNWWAFGAVAFLALSGVVGAAPAAADPFWEDVTLTPQFYCNSLTDPGFRTEICVVVDGNTAQSVVAVTNEGDAPITAEVPMLRLLVDRAQAYRRECVPSTIDAGATRGCFGPTIELDSSGDVYADLTLVVENKFTIMTSSPTRRICV